MSHNPSPLQSLNRGLIQGLAIGRQARRESRQEEVEKTLRDFQQKKLDFEESKFKLEKKKLNLSERKGLVDAIKIENPAQRFAAVKAYLRNKEVPVDDPSIKDLLDGLKTMEAHQLAAVAGVIEEYDLNNSLLDAYKTGLLKFDKIFSAVQTREKEKRKPGASEFERLSAIPKEQRTSEQGARIARMTAPPSSPESIAAAAAAGATARITAEEEQRRKRPVPGKVNRLLQGALPDNIKSVGQLEDAGFNVPDKEETRRLTQSRVGALQTIRVAQDVKDLIRARPEVVASASRAITGLINRFVSNVEGLAKIAGKTYEIDGRIVNAKELRDTKLYKGTLREMGITTARVQSMLVDLSFARVAVLQPGSRVTDKDVERALSSLGAGRGVEEEFSVVLTDVQQRTNDLYRDEVATIIGIEPNTLIERPEPTPVSPSDEPGAKFEKTLGGFHIFVRPDGTIFGMPR